MRSNIGIRGAGLVGLVAFGVTVAGGSAASAHGPSTGTWWDTSGDNVGDTFTADQSGDGRNDALAFDLDQNGSVERIDLDSNFDGYFEARLDDLSGNGVFDHAALDLDGDGSWAHYTDANEDGQPDWIPSGTSTPIVDYSMNIATITSTLLPTVYENLP